MPGGAYHRRVMYSAVISARRILCRAAWACVLAAGSGAAVSASGTATDTAIPALVVVIAVDQLRNDRLSADLPGGLGRLVREGRRFSNSSLDHGLTNTCPGHAALITGTHPGRAGIPGNDYVDRSGWRGRYCVESNQDAHRVFGGTVNRSPGLLKVTGLGDWMRAGDSNRKIYAIGGKDRSAIMLGGHQPDGVFWFDPDQVAFTSSAYYAQSLPAFVESFNARLTEEVPRQWDHPPGSFRPDDFEGESTDNGRVSGHPIKGGSESGRRIVQSPFIDELTLNLAQEIIAAEELGSREATDYLAIALSAVDSVGHLYGPFSAESEDALNRLDRQLEIFLTSLDRRLGANRYVVALSSDHGVTDLPEWSLARGVNACPVEGSRLSVTRLLAGFFGRVYWRHTRPFDMPTALVRIADGQVYINQTYLLDHQLDADSVLASVRQILADTPGVKKVWTRAEIEQGSDDVARLLRHSVVPELSGDLYLQLYPDCMIGDSGTSHGSVYAPDRSVPLLFYGAGVEAGRDETVVHSVDLAPTLARLLGIDMPEGLDGRALPLSAPRAAGGNEAE